MNTSEKHDLFTTSWLSFFQLSSGIETDFPLELHLCLISNKKKVSLSPLLIPSKKLIRTHSSTFLPFNFPFSFLLVPCFLFPNSSCLSIYLLFLFWFGFTCGVGGGMAKVKFNWQVINRCGIPCRNWADGQCSIPIGKDPTCLSRVFWAGCEVNSIRASSSNSGSVPTTKTPLSTSFRYSHYSQSVASSIRPIT